MSALSGHWLPAFNPLTGTFALPLWTTAILAGVFVMLCMLAFDRAAARGGAARIIRYCAVLLGAWLAFTMLDRLLIGERSADRRALEARSGELTARAIMSGSALACLDAGAGEVVERSCEKILFAAPETVAAGISYVAARLALLSDSLDYAERVDKSYTLQLEGIRRALEADRFGLVAHVLRNRDGCTVELCPAFALFRDKSKVVANLIGDPLEGLVAHYAANWEERTFTVTATAAPVSPATAQTLASPAIVQTPAPNPPARVSSRWDFPSSKTIPPVSIMDPEPARPGPKPAQVQDAAATPPKRSRTLQSPSGRGSHPQSSPAAGPDGSASPVSASALPRE
jgi:hypothetical protein